MSGNQLRGITLNCLDINPQMLGYWVKEHQAEEGQAFCGNGKLTPLSQPKKNSH